MKCDEATLLLGEYRDGALPEAECHEVESHLSACVACREQERALAALLAEAAALPKELEPARDLWPGIAERIRARGGVLRFPGRRAWLGTRGWSLAAAAAVLAVVSSAVTTMVVRQGEPVATAPAPGVLRPVAGGTDGLLEAEREYARATATLLQAVAERRGRLSPATRESVERNLLTIDRALAEIRDALRERPEDGALTQLLTSTHRRKLEMLQQVVKLTKA